MANPAKAVNRLLWATVFWSRSEGAWLTLAALRGRQYKPHPMQNALPVPDARENALAARLAALGIATRTYAHAPVYTVE